MPKFALVQDGKVGAAQVEPGAEIGGCDHEGQAWRGVRTADGGTIRAEQGFHPSNPGGGGAWREPGGGVVEEEKLGATDEGACQGATLAGSVVEAGGV